MAKKVLRSAEKFSEPLPLSPLPLYPSAESKAARSEEDNFLGALKGTELR